MEWALFSQDGLIFIFRWIHFLAGITWIGTLYYFNFIQGEFFKEIDANTKNIAVSKLVPRALWWFRWGAMITWIAGLAMFSMRLHSGVPLDSSWGAMAYAGALIGTFMWFNVWFVIWPAQKIIIASAQSVVGGGQADPQAAIKAPRAALASRTNTLFSIPLLFFMGAMRNLIIGKATPEANWPLYLIVLGAVVVLIELNALFGKKMGPLTTIKGVIHSGVALTAILYLIVELTL